MTCASRNNGNIKIEIEDNAGAFNEIEDKPDIGIRIVDKRIKNLVGNDYGLTIHCEPDTKTTATILLPSEGIR